jgi:hypothetical protein
VQAADFLGHHFLRPYHLRQAQPQICPACLAKDLRTQATWSVTLVTACPKHGICLLDRCLCGRPVRWRRPAIEFCECGARLTTDDQKTTAADPRELAVSSQVVRLLDPTCYGVATRPGDCLPCGFDGLSIDTFLRVIWIFGIISPGQVADHPRCASRCLPTAEAAALVCRAFDRLVSLIAKRPFREDLRVPLPALRSLYEECTTSEDRRFISSLVSRLQRHSPSRQLQRLTTIDRQLTLFGDTDEPTA